MSVKLERLSIKPKEFVSQTSQVVLNNRSRKISIDRKLTLLRSFSGKTFGYNHYVRILGVASVKNNWYVRLRVNFTRGREDEANIYIAVKGKQGYKYSRLLGRVKTMERYSIELDIEDNKFRYCLRNFKSGNVIREAVISMSFVVPDAYFLEYPKVQPEAGFRENKGMLVLFKYDHT